MRKALEPLREAGREEGLDPGREPGRDEPLAAEGRLLPIRARLSPPPPPPPPPMTRPLMSYCVRPTWLIELRESERGRPGWGGAGKARLSKNKAKTNGQIITKCHNGCDKSSST